MRPSPECFTPDPAPDALLRIELCHLCHEIGHVRSREENGTRWERYYAANCNWWTHRRYGFKVDEVWTDLIYEEEERAERLGLNELDDLCDQLPKDEERILRKIYRWRSEGSLASYKRFLPKGSPPPPVIDFMKELDLDTAASPQEEKGDVGDGIAGAADVGDVPGRQAGTQG